MLLCAFFNYSTKAQDSLSNTSRHAVIIPINAETFVNDLGLNVQIVSFKKFKPHGKAGVFLLSDYFGDWDTKEQNNQITAQALFSYDIYKGISILGGEFINNIDGFSPTVGLQYLYASKDIFILALPRIDLTRNHHYELFA